ncbi:MerR family transcriptional regulator [Lacimicrobium alkaliphilum]|uniref:MerR family transcriptional regulator n=1 Tax=Lacimicrobium alkaliphilum TaxID=1526571 RepID=A0A0U2ZQI0_9ALTE|nr:MerR family transcriptional regulator [Lacimicrobium alkaliphilum]ALT00493.1 MerR family transcriptional regulator [Lacimicrobium alkaliphilum]
MKVIELARYLQITADTVRFYTRIGILKPLRNRSNGYREYNQSDIARMRFALNARQLGFSVDDIQQLLTTADKKASPCPVARRLIVQRLEETEQRFSEMSQLRQRMKQAVEQWQQKPDKAPTGSTICHLIEDFSRQLNQQSMPNQE